MSLEDKNNLIINQLNSFKNPIPQTPLPTPVEAVENIIHDPGKKIRWNLAYGHATSGRRQRRKAKKEHGKIKEKARGLLVEERKWRKQERKQETRRERRASIVVD